ncbi:MAG: hypothetical protein ABS36_12655 [Acidobacteria bacterium SCN 69-37]|nr:MAG: hypothetical protein ABS36_12655 [Acidobacteria bacterium SCN 69-37]
METWYVRQRRIDVAVLFAALSLMPAEGIASAQSAREATNTPVITLPTRRASDTPPTPPPEVPAAADRVLAVTVSATVRRTPLNGPTQREGRTITRTFDRVHIAEKGHEWLFERNIRDHRRVSGSLIHHDARAIIAYEESDLRIMLGIRGWADVVALGFEIDTLRNHTRAEETRMIDGTRFQRYSTRQGSWMRDVWWNDEQLLVGEFTTADATGTSRFSITRIRDGIDATVLQPADSRFPTYRAFTLADWLEHR